MAYVTRSEVIMEAGSLNFEIGSTLSGTVDGANDTFTVAHFPITDKNFDDAVDTTDVTVYDDGTSVSVSSVTAGSGTITLTTPPAVSSVMTVDYVHTSVPLDFVDILIAQTEDWINTAMEKVETTPYTSPSNTIKKIARYYAAGMLVAQGHGLNNPSDDDLRNGSEKIAQAEKWLMSYKQQVIDNQAVDSGTDILQVSGDKRLFERYDSADGWVLENDADVDFNTTTSSDD